MKGAVEDDKPKKKGGRRRKRNRYLLQQKIRYIFTPHCLAIAVWFLYDETGYLQLLTVLKTVLKVVDNYKRVFDK